MKPRKLLASLLLIITLLGVGSLPTEASIQKKRTYINKSSKRIKSPVRAKTAPRGASAECWDGTFSFSANRRGTCSHHGGVKRWLR